MTLDQMDQEIGRELVKRSRQCKRGVIAVSGFERTGIARVAPNLLLWSWIPLDDPRAEVYDLALN